MGAKNTEKTIREWLRGIPVISSHEHHLETPDQQKLDLDSIFSHSYVGWCSKPKAGTREARASWLSTIRANSYFVWLEKSIMELYGCDPITEDNWDGLSQAIRRSHQDAGFHWSILSGPARYRRFVEDSYWRPGGCAGNPGLAASAYRMDSWMAGFHPDCLDHDHRNPRLFTGEKPDCLEAYLAAIRRDMESQPTVCALKCAAAYERSLRFERVSRKKAETIFGKHPSLVTEEEKKAFGNFIFFYFLSLAKEKGLPVQIHTGLAQLPGSDPLLLEPVIAQNPEIRFVLFHGGFPWIYQTASLAHNHPNVYLDMNWIPLVSTKAAVLTLHTFLEILPDSTHLSWGGDAWTSEESYGALLAMREVMAEVFSEKLSSHFYSAALVEELANGILWRNAKALYRL